MDLSELTHNIKYLSTSFDYAEARTYIVARMVARGSYKRFRMRQVIGWRQGL